jgi:hypothetical protein
MMRCTEKRRLSAASGFWKPDGLARRQRERDVLDGADLVPLLVECLAHVAGAEDRHPRLVASLGSLGHRDRRRIPWELLCLLVEVAPAAVTATEVEQIRLLPVTDVLGQGTTFGEDTPDQLGPEARQEAGDRVEPTLVLAGAGAGDATQQADGVGVARVVEHLLDGTGLDDAPGIEHTDAVTHAEDHVQVVADEQHARAELLAQRGDEVEHFRLDSGVEAGRRLVEDQQRRILRQGHGDDDALVHPARELVGVPAHDPSGIRDLDLLEHRVHPLVGLVVLDPLQREDLGDLVADADRGVQRRGRVLVHHRHLRCPQPADGGVAHGQQVLTGHPDRATAHAAVAGQVLERGVGGGRLAAAGLADQPERLAGSDLQADPAQHLLPCAADVVVDVEVVDLEGLRRGHVSGRRQILGHRSNALAIASAIMLTPITRLAIASAGNRTGHQ